MGQDRNITAGDFGQADESLRSSGSRRRGVSLRTVMFLGLTMLFTALFAAFVFVDVEIQRQDTEQSLLEEARMLGVTPGRVTQMVSAEQLQPFRRGGRTLITLDSVEARIAAAPKSGRPRKQQLAQCAKTHVNRQGPRGKE